MAGALERPATRRRLRAGRTLGALLTAAMGAIHLYLWLDGFRFIPVVGVLFLVNAAGAAVLAAALVAVPVRSLAPVAALGVLFTAGTLAGLLLSLTVGLFGVREALSAQLVPATLVVESLGTLVLAGLAVVAGRAARAR
jgi:hypothetical protein